MNAQRHHTFPRPFFHSQRLRHNVVWLLAVALAALVILLALSSTAAACPSCKNALASHDGRQGDIISGFMWSILFMLSMPFALVGSFGAYMYVLVRKARRDGSDPPQIAPGVPTQPPAERP